MNENKCKVGDHIIHNGKEMIVSQVVERGRDSYQYTNNNGNTYYIAEKKAIITACRVMENGQILTRSPIFIGDKWEHIK